MFQFFLILLFSILFIYMLTGISGAVYVPTKRKLIIKAVSLAKLNKTNIVADLGSGDGRFLFTASQLCKQAVGFEINPVLAFMTYLKSKIQGYENVKIIMRDFWASDLSQFDVIFVFLIPSKMQKLEDKIKKEAKPGARIVSFAFKFPTLKVIAEEEGLTLYKVTN